MTHERLFSPMRVSPGVMSATSYNQGTMMEKLEDLIDIAYFIYVGDVKVIGARTNREFRVKSNDGVRLVCCGAQVCLVCSEGK